MSTHDFNQLHSLKNEKEHLIALSKDKNQQDYLLVLSYLNKRIEELHQLIT